MEDMTQIRCTYCLQELSYMTDPRQLLCGHIFCMMCLESDYASEEKQCRVCSKPFTAGDLAQLPRVAPLYAYNKDLVETNTDHICDVCTYPAAKAVSYCLDCKQTICLHHDKHHSGFFEDRHKTINIKLYERRSTCSEHPTEVICVGCVSCYILACNECDSPPCTKNGGAHEFVRIKEIGQRLHQIFEEKQKQLSSQISELCKFEKEAWQTFDGYSDNFSEMVEMVALRTEEQISAIREHSRELTNQILELMKKTSDAAELYIDGINKRITSMEKIAQSVQSYFRTSTTAELACHASKRYREMDEAITAGKKVVKYEYTNVSLSDAGLVRSMGYILKCNEKSSYNNTGVVTPAPSARQNYRACSTYDCLSWDDYVSQHRYGLVSESGEEYISIE